MKLNMIIKLSAICLFLANSLYAHEQPQIPEALLPAPDSWLQRANFGTDRWGMFSFSIGDKGYAGTGVNNSGIVQRDFWEYNPATDAWTQKADFTGDARYLATGFSIGNKGYAGTGIVGSYNWRKDMFEYDPQANSWRQIADFGGGFRYTAVAFGIGSKGYMGTGNYRVSPAYNAIYYNDLWEYNPASDVWSRMADLPTAGRTGAVGTSIGDKGYVGTGAFYYDTRVKDWWEYNPTTNTWLQKASLPGTQRYGAQSFSIGDKAYVFCGYYYTPLTDMWEFDTVNNLWIQRQSFPGTTITSGVTFTIGGKGYYGVGSGKTGYASRDFWQYTPSVNFTLSCPGDKIAFATRNSCDAVVNQLDPVITPDIPIEVNYTLTYNGQQIKAGTGSVSGFTFMKGTTVVTYSLAKDPSTNCSFNVTVNDDLAPAITCMPDQVICFKAGNNYTIPEISAIDNCGIQDISYSISGATTRSGTGTDASGNFNPGNSVITWTVRDVNNNTSHCASSVRVDEAIAVNIPDVFAVNPGGNANTIYIGYGPESLTLTAIANGGNGSYTYNWSDGTSGNVINVHPSLPGTYTYVVTVTDTYGCASTETKTITVVDVRCGNDNNKVLICRVPPGNPSNSHNICVSRNAVEAHLNNGSFLGDCNAHVYTTAIQKRNKTGVAEEKLPVIFPNPNNGVFTISVNNISASDVDIRLFDQNGRMVSFKHFSMITGNKTLSVNAGVIPKGIYTVQVITAISTRSIKMVVN